MNSKLFTPVKLGPLTLSNRTIRSAAFESMCPGNKPSEQLLDYHRSVAAGGVGMTTVAYAAVTRSGLSFDRQLWMRPEIVSGLRRLTDAVHVEGAAATSPAICAISTISTAPTSSATSRNFLKSMVLAYAEAPAMIILGLHSSASSLILS